MQHILTDMACPGMTVAKDVKTPEGRILCGKGTILDEVLISRLKRMDVAKITVEGHPVPTGNEKTLEEEIVLIEKRFSTVKRIPPLMRLKRILIEKAIKSRKE